jgi:hypothetical protein
MKVLKTLLDFYVRSSLHVALCFVALFLAFHFQNFLRIDFTVLLLIFCGVIVGYNIIKYAALIEQQKNFLFKVPILVLTGMASIIALYFVFIDTYWTIFTVVVASLLSVFYAFPLIKHRNLRQVPIFKLVLVSISWVIIIGVLPLNSNYVNFNYSYDCTAMPISTKFTLLYAIDLFQLFLLIIALCIPFEIRDLKYDSLLLRTLPQLIGIYRTKLLGIIICILYLILEIVQYGLLTSAIAICTYIIIIITALLIWWSDDFKSFYYASFFVEAVPILWLGLLFLL